MDGGHRRPGVGAVGQSPWTTAPHPEIQSRCTDGLSYFKPKAHKQLLLMLMANYVGFSVTATVLRGIAKTT
jgi:hypothetical protein